MNSLSIHLHVPAGVPDPEVVARSVGAFFNPFLPLGIRVDDGPNLTPATGFEPLDALLRERERAGFSARGSKGFEGRVDWYSVSGVHDIALTGTMWAHVDSTAVDANEILAAVVEVVADLRAPLATIGAFDGPYAQRTDAHREHYQRDKEGLDRVFGLARGLSGLAFRTVLGPALVEFFGEATLAQLPADRAQRMGDGIWLLALGSNPAEPDGEAEIIAALGPQRFFDPATTTLPTDLPPLPTATHHTHRIRRKQADGALAWESSLGGTADPSDDRSAGLGDDAIATWNDQAEAYMNEREIQLEMGYVPQIVRVRINDGPERTAIIANPTVQYVFPEVDLILASEEPHGPFRAIEWTDLAPAVAGFARIEAGHRGVAHLTDNEGSQAQAVQHALRTLGTSIDPSSIERIS